jgi:hypothetical protein
MRPFLSVCVFLAFCVAPVLATAQDISSSQSQAAATASAKNSSAKNASGISDSEIAAAKASHKVWVNLDTGIYHKGGRWYGKTKNGKFMTVDDAKKAGYKPAKRD